MTTRDDSASQPTGPPADTVNYIPTVDRLTLVSWGDGSAPPMPDVDDSASDSTESIAAADTAGIIKSAMASVRASMYEHVEENGHTYHRYKAGKYPLPNDAPEQARLDLQHAVFLLTTHGKLFLAPLDNPKRVLDMATGTGIWAVEFALQFPDALVVGTDLSPVQRTFVPRNCRFAVDDAEDAWSFDAPFDFIHGRMLTSCFRDPASVIRSAFNALAPRGYLELQDARFPIAFASPPPPDCALKRWVDLIMEGAARNGRPWSNTAHYQQWMEATGFANVVQRRFVWPCNPWAKGAYYKTLGACVQDDLVNGLEGISLKLLTVMGMSHGDMQALLAAARRDLADTKIHSYMNISFWWGQRPAGAPDADGS